MINFKKKGDTMKTAINTGVKNKPVTKNTRMGLEEAASVVEKTVLAQKKWGTFSLRKRSEYFIRLAAVLRDNKERWARLITGEMGKPITDSRAEIEKCAWTAEIFAGNGARWLEEEHVTADGREHAVVFEPLGVILLILPWNYPFWQVFRAAVPALFAGNGAVLKHAGLVTGSALAAEEAFRLAGFPEHLFRTIITDHDTVDTLYENEHIQGVSFTGSTEAGRIIGEKAGRNLKKVVLELGGSDPFIVLDDADIDYTARMAARARTLNNGQSCIASKRIIVTEGVAGEFVKKFAEEMKSLILGPPLEESTELGPLSSEGAVFEMEEFVEDALEKGVRIVTGGKRPDRSGNFFEPTVLADVTPDMRCWKEEVFGPVAPVLVVADEQEAIRAANDTDFGLGASVWTIDLQRGKRIAASLHAGAVFINSPTKSDPRVPIGGIKKSGLGRELSYYGLKEFVNIKSINVYNHGNV
jgi:succinate-semialdehyde dehydrogenase/glutarate-semialdehyde dehydrogenase